MANRSADHQPLGFIEGLSTTETHDEYPITPVRVIIANNYVESLQPIRNTLRISEDSFGRRHPLTAPAGRTRAEGDWERATPLASDNTLVNGGLRDWLVQ